MIIDYSVRLSDLLLWGSVAGTAFKIILTNRDILKNTIRMVADHESRIKEIKSIVDDHDDVIIRNGLDLKADRNLQRRRHVARPES